MSASERLHADRPTGEIATVAPMNAPRRVHRRTDRRTAIGLVGTVLGLIGVPLMLRGLAAAVRGRGDVDGAIVISLIGAVLFVIGVGALVWSRRTLTAARTSDAQDSVVAHGVVLPHGVVPAGQGVRIVARPGVRVVTIVAGALFLLVTLMMWGAGVPLGGVLITAGLTVLMSVVLWTNLRQELEVDGLGVRRVRWPRQEVAWADVTSVDTGRAGPGRWWSRSAVDDIALHAPGRVRASRGRTSDALVVRVDYLQASRPEVMRVLQQLHEHGRVLPGPSGGPVSGRSTPGPRRGTGRTT